MLADDKPSVIVAANYQVIAHTVLATRVPPPVSELSHSSRYVCRQMTGKAFLSSVYPPPTPPHV